jgi:hypothetical protein
VTSKLRAGINWAKGDMRGEEARRKKTVHAAAGEREPDSEFRK